MATKTESADLILKLYDLRREKKMRRARKWYTSSFNPKTAQDVMEATMDPETGAYFRMVTSYWDMACTMVNHGAIDAELFAETNGEHFIVYAKLEPFVVDMRVLWDRPQMYSALEKCIMGSPNGPERLRKTQELIARILSARADQGKGKDKKKNKEKDGDKGRDDS
jgi:hypothetical protein